MTSNDHTPACGICLIDYLPKRPPGLCRFDPASAPEKLAHGLVFTQVPTSLIDAPGSRTPLTSVQYVQNTNWFLMQALSTAGKDILVSNCRIVRSGRGAALARLCNHPPCRQRKGGARSKPCPRAPEQPLMLGPRRLNLSGMPSDKAIPENDRLQPLSGWFETFGMKQWCPEEDSNLHALASAST
jgi:hypothetical protein